MAKGDDIQERLIDFAVAIIKLCSMLPDIPAGRHIAGQLLRAGTAPAPNYSEGRGAESRRDFIHKFGIVLKELNESEIWLVIARRSKMLREEDVKEIEGECIELQKIIATSIRTARNGKPTRPSD